MNSPSSVRRTGGGRFNPDDDPFFFFAGNRELVELIKDFPSSHGPKNILLAVNHIDASGDWWKLGLEDGNRLLLDSGIFNLAMTHARKHGIHMNEALAMSPDKTDGFSALWTRYLEIVDDIKDKCWGYIELDLGGREQKIKTRAKLEKKGLRPIPVFHPLNDGWDYLDYLLKRYDRICIGNLVKASNSLRIRLLLEVSRRIKHYPNVWCHLLGVSPGVAVNTFARGSCDSSSWGSCFRWGLAYSPNLENISGGLTKNLVTPSTVSVIERKSSTRAVLMSMALQDQSRAPVFNDIQNL